MPSAPILNLGSRWKAEDVFWRTHPKNALLLGVPTKAKRTTPVNFAQQSGVYVLFSDDNPIYVGKANGTLFSRLKTHYFRGDFAGRWNRFTWFGLRGVVGGTKPRLKDQAAAFHISTEQLLDHLEAILIHAIEPHLNGQEGRFGQRVTRYMQIRDPRLGPSDRELMEAMAVAGNLLPPSKVITKTGWKDA